MDAIIAGIIDGISLGLLSYLFRFVFLRLKLSAILNLIITLLLIAFYYQYVQGPLIFLHSADILTMSNLGHGGLEYIFPYMISAFLSFTVAHLIPIKAKPENKN